MASASSSALSDNSSGSLQDDDSTNILENLARCSSTGQVAADVDLPANGQGFAGKPRRSSILKSGRPRVKKSVSFCSMPEDRRVSNGKPAFRFITKQNLTFCMARRNDVQPSMLRYLKLRSRFAHNCYCVMCVCPYLRVVRQSMINPFGAYMVISQLKIS